MRVHNLLIVLATFAAITHTIRAELIDAYDVERFCYPEAYKNSRKSCECNNDNMPPWGMRAVQIDCSYKDLKTSELSEVLPLYVDTLDLSWNTLVKVPIFTSDSLRLLNLMHNNISSISSKNFVKISNLHELYLNWNSIQTIELNAFDDLAHLQILDLSHNNLHALSAQIFRPMLVLESLSLSWNRQLNHTTGIESLDFYQTFGVSTNLRALKLEACSLSNLVLPERVNLLELNLRRNLLNKMPEKLPNALEKLDISGNLFEALRPNDTAKLTHIQELYVEDMPHLKSIEEDAFVPLQSLKKISFQNTRALTNFDYNAFGASSTKWPPLRVMIFRGTSICHFNATLSPVFHQLTELDLNGVPLSCDCDLTWMKGLRVETFGRCFEPARMRGMPLSQARLNDFSCDSWPRWVYSLIILTLIVFCSVCIYFIVMCLRPHRNVTMRRKVGAGSPYARVTIEPNNQENVLH